MVVVGVVAVCSTRVALLLPVKYLVRVGFCLLLPAGAHAVFRRSEAESTRLRLVGRVTVRHSATGERDRAVANDDERTRLFSV